MWSCLFVKCRILSFINLGMSQGVLAAASFPILWPVFIWAGSYCQSSRVSISEICLPFFWLLVSRFRLDVETGDHQQKWVSGLEKRELLQGKDAWIWGITKTISSGFPGGPLVKNLPCNVGNTGSIPGPGRPHMPWSKLAQAPQTTTEAHIL